MNFGGQSWPTQAGDARLQQDYPHDSLQPPKPSVLTCPLSGRPGEAVPLPLPRGHGLVPESLTLYASDPVHHPSRCQPVKDVQDVQV